MQTNIQPSRLHAKRPTRCVSISADTPTIGRRTPNFSHNHDTESPHSDNTPIPARQSDLTSHTNVAEFCHCEERSDAAIATGAGTDRSTILTEIASLRSQ